MRFNTTQTKILPLITYLCSLSQIFCKSRNITYLCIVKHISNKEEIIMKEITVDTKKIATCGLYCGACKKNRMGKCPGCHENEKASWCKIRKCCIEKGFHTCAECEMDVKDCRLHNNLIGKFFSFVFRSDRPACIRYIRENGEQAFAEEMTKRGEQTIKK